MWRGGRRWEVTTDRSQNGRVDPQWNYGSRPSCRMEWYSWSGLCKVYNSGIYTECENPVHIYPITSFLINKTTNSTLSNVPCLMIICQCILLCYFNETTFFKLCTLKQVELIPSKPALVANWDVSDQLLVLATVEESGISPLFVTTYNKLTLGRQL